MSKRSQEADAPMNVGFSQMTMNNQSSLLAFFSSYEKWVRSTVQIQSDLLEFLGMRMRKDLEMPQRLAECGDAADLIQQHMEFTNTMLKDYANESQKIMRLISQAAQDIEMEAETALTDGEERTDN